MSEHGVNDSDDVSVLSGSGAVYVYKRNPSNGYMGVTYKAQGVRYHNYGPIFRTQHGYQCRATYAIDSSGYIFTRLLDRIRHMGVYEYSHGTCHNRCVARSSVELINIIRRPRHYGLSICHDVTTGPRCK